MKIKGPTIKRMQLSLLKPADYNPQKHSPRMLQDLSRGMKTWGYLQHIIYNKRTQHVVGGHARLEVLLKEGETEADIVVVDLSLKEEKALNIALNKIHGEPDDDKLAALIAELQVSGIDASLTGFTDREISLMVQKYNQGDRDLDQAKPAPKKPRSRRGDVYHLGWHRLMCGSCTDPADMKTLMRKDKADLIFTDPPYNLGFAGTVDDQFDVLLNDNLTDSEYEKFTEAWMHQLNIYAKRAAGWYVCIDWRRYPTIVKGLLMRGLKIHNCIVWDKVFAGMGRRYRFRHEFLVFAGHEEMTWYGSTQDEDVIKLARIERKGDTVLDMKGLSLKVARGYVRVKREKTSPPRVPIVGGGGRKELTFIVQEDLESDVWEGFSMNYFQQRRQEASDGIVHPTMKPIGLILTAVENSSRADDIVLDSFAGSGSTLIACEKQGRRCLAMELDPRYVDQAVHRWEEYTGKKAKLQRGGKR